ncbi:MAG: energy transducer TonB [Luteimonas sp.]
MRIGSHEGLRWAASLGAVLAAHGLLATAAVLLAHTGPVIADQAPMEAVMVELAPEPEAPPAPPTDIPPGPPQREQQRPEPQPRPEPKVFETPPLEEPEVQDPEPPEEPEEAREQDVPSDAASIQQTLAPPQVDARQSSRYAALQTVSGASGQMAADWQGLLLGHLEQYRRYPRQAQRRRLEGTAHVRFQIDRQGNVYNPRIGRSSGHAPLDEETLATVRRASPVPAPPADIPGDPVEVLVPVNFFIHQ